MGTDTLTPDIALPVANLTDSKRTSIRPFVKEDLPALTDIVRATSVFRPEEVEIAVELMQAAVDDPAQDDYLLFTGLSDEGRPVGYYCAGSTPMTESTYDLYWIAVDPNLHGKGVGHDLIRHCEELVRKRGGKLIMVETSSQPKYDATNRFYIRHEYGVAGRVENYYAPGDDLIVYTKYL